MSETLNNKLIRIYNEKKDIHETIRKKNEERLIFLMQDKIMPVLIREIEDHLISQVEDASSSPDWSMNFVPAGPLFIIPASISKAVVREIEDLCEKLSFSLVDDKHDYVVKDSYIEIFHTMDSRIQRQVTLDSISDTHLYLFEPLVTHFLAQGFEKFNISFRREEHTRNHRIKMMFQIKNPFSSISD